MNKPKQPETIKEKIEEILTFHKVPCLKRNCPIVERLSDLFSSLYSQIRQEVLEEVRNNVIQFAIEIENEADEWKGAALYLKILKYFDRESLRKKKIEYTQIRVNRAGTNNQLLDAISDIERKVDEIVDILNKEAQTKVEVSS